MKQQFLEYLAQIGTHLIPPRHLESLAPNEKITFPEVLIVQLLQVQYDKEEKSWLGKIKDQKGTTWDIILADDSLYHILTDTSLRSQLPTSISILDGVRIDNKPLLKATRIIYDNFHFINANLFINYSRCPMIIYLTNNLGVYRPLSQAMARGTIVHDFHENIYNILEPIFQENFDAFIERSREIVDTIINRHWNLLASVDLTGYEALFRYFDLKQIVSTFQEVKSDILWESDKIMTEFRINSPIFGLQGVIDRLEIRKDGLFVIEMKTGRRGAFKEESAFLQAAAYGLILTSYGLEVKELRVEFPDEGADYRFSKKQLEEDYFRLIPAYRNDLYQLILGQSLKYRDTVPYLRCQRFCYYRKPCQFYCFIRNVSENKVTTRCNPNVCRFRDNKIPEKDFCAYPSQLVNYPLNLEFVNHFINWYRAHLHAEIKQVHQEIKNLSLRPETLEKNGTTLASLRITPLDTQNFSYCHAQYIDSQTGDVAPLPPTRIREGDSVILTPINHTPRSHHSFYGTIEQITNDSLLIHLREGNEHIFRRLYTQNPQFVYRLDSYTSLSTIKRQLQALDILFRGPHDSEIQKDFPFVEKLLNLLLFFQKPQFTENSYTPKISHLNERQQQAVKTALKAQDLCLIHGPPGSGKTTVICEIVKELLKQDKEGKDPINHPSITNKILVTAFTKKAVDNFVKKWQTSYQNYGKLVRIGAVESKDTDLVHTSLEYQLMKSYGQKDLAEAAIEILNGADIVVSTIASAFHSLLLKRTFKTVIIDEAAQATEPLSLLAALKGYKLILVGDHIQLPPVVTAETKIPLEPNVARHCHINTQGPQDTWDDLSLSMFNRLMRHYENDPNVTVFLNTQYRMNPLISEFASLFYHEPIFPGFKDQRTLDLFLQRLHEQWKILTFDDEILQKIWDVKHPIVFVDTKNKKWYQNSHGDSESSYNMGEAGFIAEILASFFQTLISQGHNIDNESLSRLLKQIASEIGITTPYRTQVIKIMTTLRNQFLQLAPLKEHELHAHLSRQIMIDTVDRFQGQEREIMIISLVDSNPEHVVSSLSKDQRRLNVAITRAKRKVIIVGDSSTLTTVNFFATLVSYIKKINGFITI